MGIAAGCEVHVTGAANGRADDAREAARAAAGVAGVAARGAAVAAAEPRPAGREHCRCIAKDVKVGAGTGCLLPPNVAVISLATISIARVVAPSRCGGACMQGLYDL